MNRFPKLAVLAMGALIAGVAGCSGADPAGPDAGPAFASSRPPFVFPSACCYYEGRVVRTVVPPASTPREGRDAFYAFPSGAAENQKGIVAVVPGDAGYHGGHWAFHAVTWNVSPYLLTSDDAVLAAAAAGDITITRLPGNDFRCPIQL